MSALGLQSHPGSRRKATFLLKEVKLCCLTLPYPHRRADESISQRTELVTVHCPYPVSSHSGAHQVRHFHTLLSPHPSISPSWMDPNQQLFSGNRAERVREELDFSISPLQVSQSKACPGWRREGALNWRKYWSFNYRPGRTLNYRTREQKSYQAHPRLGKLI